MTDGSKYLAEPPGYEDKQRLYELYWGEYLSTREIGQRFGVSGETIRCKMDVKGIPRRKQNDLISKVKKKRGFVPSEYHTGTEYVDVERAETLKEHLYRLYWGYYLTTYDVAERLEKSTYWVRSKMDEVGIPRRGRYGSKQIIEKERGFIPTCFRKTTAGDHVPMAASKRGEQSHEIAGD